MRILEKLVVSVFLGLFVLVTVGSVGATIEANDASGLGALAGGCVVGLAILIHGAMTRQPLKE